MFRVLIVEDEAVIRQGLIQSIHWDDLDMTLAGQAENGSQALDILATTPVDIILTDMRMPVCDGQRMLEEMEKQGFDCEIIVLSEYTDFAYMRQAIHAHVFDYLLKPVSADDLNMLFQRVAEKLKQNAVSDIPQQDDLSALFSCAAAADPGNTEEAVSVFLASHGDSAFAVSEIFSADHVDLSGAFHSLAGRAPFESRILPLGDGHKCAVLTLLPTPLTGQVDYNYRAWLRELCEKADILPFRAGISERKDSLLRLHDALSEAAASLCFSGKQGAYIEYAAIRELAVPQYPVPINDRQLTELLKSGRDVRNEVKHVFLSAFDQREYIYMPAARRMLMEFSLCLERCCQEAGKSVNISALIGGNYLDQINRIEWKQELDALFELIVDKTFAVIAEQDTNTTEGVLRRVLNAVQTQYMDDLSLIRFAQEYHINYIYLSRKFKELTGETFTNYLMKVRMDRAKQLIEQDGFSEKEAAPLVGYTNPYYFISSYKKYFNLEEGQNGN